MQNKLRKVLAILGVVAMLCTLLPMGIMSVSAEDETILSWDFEDGNVGFTSGGPGQSIVVDPDDSTNHVLYWACSSNYGEIRKVIALEKNTDYVFNFKMKTSLGKGAFITVQTASWGAYDQVSFSTSTTWTEHSIEFNTGDTFDSVMLKIQNNGTIQDYWVDNFTVIKKETVEPEIPEGGETTYENVLEMDWEDGNAVFKNASVVAEGPDGSNSMKYSFTGGYSSTYRSVSGFEDNADYLITFKAKSSAGASMFVTFQDGSWGSTYYNETFKPTTEWAEYSITTNIGDTPNSSGAILFKFQDTGTAQELWIDDLSIAKIIKPESDEEDNENMVVNGDFETGDLSGWTKHQSTVISTTAHGGSYAANLKGTGGSTACLVLGFFNVWGYLRVPMLHMNSWWWAYVVIGAILLVLNISGVIQQIRASHQKAVNAYN